MGTEPQDTKGGSRGSRADDRAWAQLQDSGRLGLLLCTLDLALGLPASGQSTRACHHLWTACGSMRKSPRDPVFHSLPWFTPSLSLYPAASSCRGPQPEASLERHHLGMGLGAQTPARTPPPQTATDPPNTPVSVLLLWTLGQGALPQPTLQTASLPAPCSIPIVLMSKLRLLTPPPMRCLMGQRGRVPVVHPTRSTQPAQPSPATPALCTCPVQASLYTVNTRLGRRREGPDVHAHTAPSWGSHKTNKSEAIGSS